ncbi:hypothetical protein PABY_06510 [Pyrodictium abyssi]|uniref:Type II toxin-antitoxin system PemK/MazF family toxin n=1 Tax=Pyrodictium abyssi TaxID=54256 RepID=A0ABM8IU55_9CREN|nr:hypothetical protein PABY_06510 [Pyrodictium abyssi]
MARSHPEYAMTGLKVDSVIKLTKIATLHKKLIAGELGEAGPMLRQEVNEKITRVLLL